MQGRENILNILIKSQIYGIAPTLTLVTSFDNAKDIQDPPELHVQFRGEHVSVLHVGAMCADDEDDMTDRPTAAEASGVDALTVMSGKKTKRSTRANTKLPEKYSLDVYGKQQF